MNQAASSLRLRLFIGALGAGLFASALLAIALLLEVRDGLYARRVADARAQLHDEVVSAEAHCRGARGCMRDLFAHRDSAGLTRSDAPCAAPLLRAGSMASVCADLPGDEGALHLAVPLDPVRDQLRALDEEMLLSLALALALSVLLSLIVFERGVLRRLRAVDSSLEELAVQGERELLPEGGDALGRLGGAVNRLASRLAEERTRTSAQIVSLQETNRALAEEKQALREAREDLSRSERLASAGRLAAGVAHEVGNPISAVIAYAALLTERLARLERDSKRDQPGDLSTNPLQDQLDQKAIAEAREFAERIERESSRVDRILRDLLDLARPRQPRLESIELGRVLTAARALVEPQPIFHGISIAAELPAELPPVRGEEHYVVQVLVNLFTNSAKAGAKRIQVRARVEPNEAAAASEMVLLEIEDDGRGISPELLPRLFEPFVTSASPGQGTGLGLALSHATMERIGGSIAVRAAPSAGERTGALFTLRFQRSPR